MHCHLQSLAHSVHGESEVQTAQWLPEASLLTSVLEPRQAPCLLGHQDKLTLEHLIPETN